MSHAARSNQHRHIRPAPRLIVPWGSAKTRDQRPFPMIWDSHAALNGHGIIIGGSGSGKTHQLRRFLTCLAGSNAIVHLIDPHGDIIPNAPHSSVRFGESTPYGLNPLEVSGDLDHGGPRKKANAFIGLLLRQMTLGDKQRAALFRLLIDLYARYGFEVEDPRTWSLDYDPRTWARVRKRHPGIIDLRKHVYEKLKAMKFGLSGAASQRFEEVAKLQAQLNRLRLKNARGDDVEQALVKAKAAAMEAYGEALEKLDTGKELDDLLAWDSTDAIKGLYDRIESLEQSGIFKGTAPNFDPGLNIRRYDLAPLTRTEQQIFVDCLLEQLFYDAKRRGEAQGPDTVIVIDEASIFLDDDDDHIINIIIREARKFGVSLWLAAQEMNRFPKPVVQSTATKIILGVDSTEQRSMERRLVLPDGMIGNIKPKISALVQIRNSGRTDMSNTYYDVHLAA